MIGHLFRLPHPLFLAVPFGGVRFPDIIDRGVCSWTRIESVLKVRLGGLASFVCDLQDPPAKYALGKTEDRLSPLRALDTAHCLLTLGPRPALEA